MVGQPETGAVKPPYSVPSMAEIEATEPNGLVVASTFSGAGGSCLGYRMAGFQVAWANEFEPHAVETYRRNHPATVLDERDIRKVKGQDILDAVGPIDLFDGSPPCQSFSMAGKRSSGWGKEIAHADGTTQVSDDLFFEYARLLGELRPRVFVAENVAGLVRGVAKGYYKRIFAALVDQGYSVRTRLLDAQWLGVPQSRKRVILIGYRDDVPKPDDNWHPSPFPWRYSIAEACPAASGASQQRPVMELSTNRFAKQPRPSEPSPTVLASSAGWSDISVERRKLSIAEVKRLCSFPDDFDLQGSYAQQWARLGNSVPPLMMRAVAEKIARQLLLDTVANLRYSDDTTP
jgi:DNA (cytosine-5)-methyltransferase 1